MVSKPEKMYILSSGKYYGGDRGVIAIVHTKKEAAKLCRDDGYRWSSQDQLFCHEQKQKWIKVQQIKVGCRDGSRRVSYGRTKKQRKRDEAFGFRLP